MPDPYTAIQIVMMPRDTNPHGTIFGGVILSYIDMAGATAARREVALRGGSADIKIVTVAVNRVEFKQPVMVGDVVRFETTVERFGRTSITMRINVVAERVGREIRVTESEVVYVGVDDSRQPVPLLPVRPADNQGTPPSS
jgi:acyl-CoA thioesterase YciA